MVALRRFLIKPSSLLGSQSRFLSSNKWLSSPHTVGIIGAPLSFGQPKVGTSEGPGLLRFTGIHDGIIDLGWQVDDIGDLDFGQLEWTSNHPGAKYSAAVGQANRIIHEQVAKQVEAGRLCLTLGGDHSIGIGTVSGVLRKYPNLGVIWVDAHADINTPETSPSGNLHGQPVSFLSGLTDPSKISGFEWLAGPEQNKLPLDQLVYIGLRDVDSGEKSIIKQHNIKSFSMHEVDRYGIGKVVEMALEYLKDRPIHMSFDIDAMDPILAPSTGTDVRGGLEFREGHFICESIFQSNRLVSMDMVEVNPKLAKDIGGPQKTAELANELVFSAMGQSIL